ncbi:hypothetical protein V9K67_06860 [Paraflavisolibacter sp. H34]|uniref:hypothetical protein n=1 Tax=Huijunlia imazamoxiresistens TaxID=3127457 RepID=UPI0030183691
MKKFVFSLFLLLLSSGLWAQSQQPVRHKIALFVPLYLDSAFSGYNYRYDKTFPKFLIPGLEFYQGAQLALDSLKKAGAPLDVYVYDSRSHRLPLSTRLANPELNNVELFIANANAAEVQTLAQEAHRRQIPFVSATLPNDAGVVNNPYFVLLNSTLRTHCEGIYQYLQKYHSQDRIILFRKNGVQEGLILDYLKDIAGTTTAAPLKMEFVDLEGEFEEAALAARLDSTRKTVCIAGSLDERFGLKLAQHLASLSQYYPLTLVGMPTWDGIKEFSRNEFKNIEIVYSTPFYYRRYSGLKNHLTNQFEAAVNGRPTDMLFRGYETMLRFALLLLEAKTDLGSNLTRKGNTVFTQFDIQPVFLNKANMTLDYFENKHLYFVKYINGIQTVVN